MRLQPLVLALGMALSLALPAFAQQPQHGQVQAPPANAAQPGKAAQPVAAPVQGVKVDVRLPPDAVVAVPPALKPVFPKGLPQGMGFGLTCALAQPGGFMIFHGVTGRGPVQAGPMLQESEGLAPTAIFAVPDYSPAVVSLKVTPQFAEPLAILPIKDSQGTPMRCLPPGPARPGDLAEVPLDSALKRLPYDPRGIDPQGVVQDFKRNSLWVCDAYGPALYRLEMATGVIREAVRPGAGLPSLLTGRSKPGMGFNGVCVTPSGLVVTIYRAPWEEDGVRGIFSRIVEYDPDSQRVRQFAYPVDLDDYKEGREIHTGSIVCVSENKYLILEQCRKDDGRWENKVYAADTSKAVSINILKTADDKALETVTSPALWAKDHVRMAVKTLVLDLNGAGWQGLEAESMALLPNGRTLAVMAGGGFGVKAVVENPGKDAEGRPVTAPAAYVLDGSGVLHLDGAPTKATVALKPERDTPELWMFALPKAAKDY